MKILKQSGFTMLEFIVSIFIIGLISSIVVSNYRSSGRQSRLDMAVQKLISDIRLVQDYSLGLKEFNASLPDGGWGIYLQPDSNQYIIFAEDMLDGEYTDASELYKIITLPQDIKISAGNFDGTSESGGPYNNKDHLFVIFEPPDPTTHINARDQLSNPPHPQNENEAQEVVIQFEFVDTGYTSAITINSMGLIEFN